MWESSAFLYQLFSHFLCTLTSNCEIVMNACNCCTMMHFGWSPTPSFLQAVLEALKCSVDDIGVAVFDEWMCEEKRDELQWKSWISDFSRLRSPTNAWKTGDLGLIPRQMTPPTPLFLPQHGLRPSVGPCSCGFDRPAFSMHSIWPPPACFRMLCKSACSPQPMRFRLFASSFSAYNTL